MLCVYAVKVICVAGGAMVDSAVFEAAYAAHGASVLRYATYSAGSRQAAEDIAAEAWARSLEKGARIPAGRRSLWAVSPEQDSSYRVSGRGRGGPGPASHVGASTPAARRIRGNRELRRRARENRGPELRVGARMGEEAANHAALGEEGDDPRHAVAAGTDERIDFATHGE